MFINTSAIIIAIKARPNIGFGANHYQGKADVEYV